MKTFCFTAVIAVFLFICRNNGYAVGYEGTIIKTSDGGTTWETLTSGINFPLTSVFFTDANIGYAVGDNRTVIKTNDGGKPH